MKAEVGFLRPRPRLFSYNKEKNNEKKNLMATAASVAGRGKKRSKCAVPVKAEQQRNDNRQAASAEDIGAEETVLRSEN